MACHWHYSISKSPYARMATTLLNSTKKPAKKPLFVHHQSAILTKSKLNFIRKERKRIENRCSSHIFATQHLNTFDDTLRLNGYPENSIEQTKRPQNPQRNPQPAHTEWSYLKIPYISERLNHRITTIFRKVKHPGMHCPQILHSQASPIAHLHEAQMH